MARFSYSSYSLLKLSPQLSRAKQPMDPAGVPMPDRYVWWAFAELDATRVATLAENASYSLS